MSRQLVGALVVVIVALRLAVTSRELRRLRGGHSWDDPTSMDPLFREPGFRRRVNAVYARIIRDIVLLLSLMLIAELLL